MKAKPKVRNKKKKKKSLIVNNGKIYNDFSTTDRVGNIGPEMHFQEPSLPPAAPAAASDVQRG
jgi:hypothetical protein